MPTEVDVTVWLRTLCVAAILPGAALGCSHSSPEHVGVVLQGDALAVNEIEKAVARNPVATDPQSKQEYFIQIVKPDSKVDYKIVVIQPDPNVRYSLRILDAEGRDINATDGSKLSSALRNMLKASEAGPK
jgi:hypothetical protein